MQKNEQLKKIATGTIAVNFLRLKRLHAKLYCKLTLHLKCSAHNKNKSRDRDKASKTGTALCLMTPKFTPGVSKLLRI